MFYVNSLQHARWFDGTLREIVDVSPGTIVAFRSPDDALKFGDGKRGVPVSPLEANGEAGSPPVREARTQTRQRKKGADDV